MAKLHPSHGLKIPQTTLSYSVPTYSATKPQCDICMSSAVPTGTPDSTDHTLPSTGNLNSIQRTSSQNEDNDTTLEDSLPTSSEYMRNAASAASAPFSDAAATVADDWTSGKLSPARLENFAQQVLPTNVQAYLSQPFGKDNKYHSFASQKCFRHILLALFTSGF